MSPPAKGTEPPSPVYLLTGESAPFAGDLLPPARSARLLAQVEGCQARLDLELKRAVAHAEIDAQKQAAIMQIDLDLERARSALLEKNNAELNAWFRRPTVVIAITSTITAVFVIGSALAFREITIARVGGV